MGKVLTPFQRKVDGALQHQRVMAYGDLPTNYGDDAYNIAERVDSTPQAVGRALRALSKLELATFIPKEQYKHDTYGEWWWKTWKGATTP